MKLIRLLVPLAMLVAGLAVPASATATDLPERPRMRPEALSGACAAVAGSLRSDLRIGQYCAVSDGTIDCTDREGCYYHPMPRLDRPPLKGPCELVRGGIRDVVVGQIACEIKDGVIVVDCVLDVRLSPWWSWPERYVIVCEVRWIPSEQPMT